jgi:hypothetical protein
MTTRKTSTPKPTATVFAFPVHKNTAAMAKRAHELTEMSPYDAARSLLDELTSRRASLTAMGVREEQIERMLRAWLAVMNDEISRAAGRRLSWAKATASTAPSS